MASSPNTDSLVATNGNGGTSATSDGGIPISISRAETGTQEIKAKVDAVWEQMDKGLSKRSLNALISKPTSTVRKTSQNKSSNVLAYLGLAPKKTNPSPGEDVKHSTPTTGAENDTSDEGKKLAAAALQAVKDASAVALSRGKVEITEVRDFAGQEIEVKKLVDANSKEAAERANAAPSSAVDAVLEQIKKKQKLSVLDKTKKDWGEFKVKDKEVEEELDAYKKSSNQYLEKVSFLQRADYREFERERDARLAMQARRKPGSLEEP